MTSSRAFLLSALAGAYLGVSLQLVAASLSVPIPSSEMWAIPVLVLIYGTVALPFVILGLAIFALPATRLLRRSARQWWVGVVAVIWGALAGKLMFLAIDRLMFFGNYDFAEISIRDIGMTYGVATAVAWWLRHRRELEYD